jgi:outer membrane protein OmpA-like peptidoglycan-associated protein/tetratricopeptide (TPR) repeat protein
MTLFSHLLKPLLFVMIIGFAWDLTAQDTISDPCKPVLKKKEMPLYQEGMSAFRRGSYYQAERSMQTLLLTNPGVADAFYVLGMINVKRKDSDFRKAERHFRELLRICPGYDPYVYYYLGEISYSFDRFDSTIICMEEFLKDVDRVKSDEDYERALSLIEYSRFYREMVGNPVPFQPEVVEGISTAENEYLPILSPDNQMAFFTREVKILPDKNALFSTPGFKEKFMFSMKGNSGGFSSGEEMPEPFNVFDNEGGATLTADNRLLIYTVCMYEGTSRYLNCDLWSSENEMYGWSDILNLGKKVNRPDSWESQPTISADGSTLYFISDRPGGYGGYDVYRSYCDSAGNWGTPVNLGQTINTDGNEKSPFIHPDGKTFYFSSDGRMGLGGYDIFYARLAEDGRFQKAVNLGYPINSSDDEVGFFVSTEGSHGFFASNKLQGHGGWDLYSFELYPGARPEKVLFIKGTVREENTMAPVKARIELKNVDTKKVSEVPFDSTTGNYVAVTSFNNDYVMTIKKEGYVYESKYLSRADSILKAPATVDMEIQPIELDKSYRINDIYFEFNSFGLTQASKVVLDQLTEFLTFNQAISICIQGHTDNIGSDADNMRLSENRAGSVYEYLLAHGVNKSRLAYKGFGESEPLADNSTEEGRARNRRTCFMITRK